MGFGEATFQKLHDTKKTITVNNGTQILKQCVDTRNGGTKYSNSYNLTTGDIVFYQFGNTTETTSINLSKELEKGSHYYEISKIAEQTIQPAVPLMLNMNRHVTSIYKPLTNQEAATTTKIKHLFKDVTTGRLSFDDLSEKLSADLKKDEANVKSVLERMGKLNSLDLVHKERKHELTDYSYIMKFEKVTILWQFLFDENNKISDFNNLSVSWIR